VSGGGRTRVGHVRGGGGEGVSNSAQPRPVGWDVFERVLVKEELFSGWGREESREGEGIVQHCARTPVRQVVR
jgi:hypothetical protein